MTTSRNILFYLVICTAAGTTACATAESNPAGDAGVLADNGDAGRAGFDAAPAGGDASIPSTDAGGTDATTNPVCSTGNEPCATGCCAIAAPDELAPWTTGTVVATGTCQNTEIYPYSCYPSTPGRDANGCCVANINAAVETSTLTFNILVLADGRHELTTTACTFAIGNFANSAICTITATASQAVVGGPLRNSNAALKSTNYLPYYGPLTSGIANGSLAVGYAGIANGFGGRCGITTYYKSCTWTAQ